jgi:hypothetical protein
MNREIWPLIVWCVAVLLFTAFIFWLTHNYWTLLFILFTFRWVYDGDEAKK